MIGQLLEFALGVGLEAGRIAYLKDNFIPRALSIASHQGWVSPGRMSTQCGLSRRDAQIVLFGACQQGLLYQATNGRFYVKEQSPQITPAPVYAPTRGHDNDLTWGDDSIKLPVIEHREPNKLIGTVPILLIIGFVVLICIAAIFTKSNSEGNVTILPVSGYQPTEPAATPTESAPAKPIERIATATPSPTPTVTATASTLTPTLAPHKHKHTKHKPRPTPSAHPKPADTWGDVRE